MAGQTASTAISTTADPLWDALVDRYRDAKSLALCGEREAARALMKDALPPLIRDWSRACRLPRHLQILRLRELFNGSIDRFLQPVQERKPEIEAADKPAPRSLRVPIRDVSRMIDVLHLQEAQARRDSPQAAKRTSTLP